MSNSKVLSAVSANLSAKFVKTDEFAKEFSLALLSGISPIFYGEGGYGKTEMILQAMKTFQVSNAMLECHPEMPVSGLFGGAIAKTEIEHIRQEDGSVFGIEKTLESVNYERGLLKNYLYFLEEMMDNPMNVLTTLKSVMTNKMWDSMQSEHRLIIGATNIDPYALLEEVPFNYQNSYDALLQRFLVIRHEWDSHESSDYLSLFRFKPNKTQDFVKVSRQTLENEVGEVSKIPISLELAEILSELAAKSAEAGSKVSPRVAMWTLRLLRTEAFLSSRSTVTLDDLHVLGYMGSWHDSIFEELQELLAKIESDKKYQTQLADFHHKYELVNNFWHNAAGNAHFKSLNCAKALTTLLDEVSAWQTNDAMKRQKDNLMAEIRSDLADYQQKAESSVVYQSIF